MLTFGVENWAEAKAEIMLLWPLHWEEIANDKERIELAPDVEAYDRLGENGELHIIVARSAGKLVGYHFWFVKPHIHYKTTLMAFTDIFFLLPEFRRGRNGLNLFKFGEKSLKARGVKKLFIGSKLKLDLSTLFAYLGYAKTEVFYSKYLGD